MNNEELKELEKSFIIAEDLQIDEIKALINKIIQFCNIDQKGYVLIKKDKELTDTDKILLILAARYLANKLQELLNKESPITYELTISEISDMIKKENKLISARLKDLKDENKLLSVSRGVYKVAPHIIESFLKEIGDKNGK